MFVVLEKTNADGSISRTVKQGGDPCVEVMTSMSWRLVSSHDEEEEARRASVVLPAIEDFTGAICPYLEEAAKLLPPGWEKGIKPRFPAAPAAPAPAPVRTYTPSGGINAPHGARTPTGVWSRLVMPAPRRHNPQQFWVLSVSKAGNITGLCPARGKTVLEVQKHLRLGDKPAELYGVCNHPTHGLIVGRAYMTESGSVIAQALHPEWALEAALDRRGAPADRMQGGAATPHSFYGRFVRCDPGRVPAELCKKPAGSGSRNLGIKY